MRPDSNIKIVLLALVGFIAVGCGEHEKPNFIYMPNMVYSPSIKAQEEGSMLQPVPGTVARGQKIYPFPGDPDGAGKNLKNPLERKLEVLKRGKEIFNIYCIVCHGPGGKGDGTVVPKFPRPPSLVSEKVRDYPDGRIFHIISNGQNLMPGYASQIEIEDRWAVVHYVRVLYRADNPTSADLEKVKKR